MAGFLSSDDPFPITAGSESFFSPGAIATTVFEPSQIEPNPRKRARTSNVFTPTPNSNNDLTARELATRLSSADQNVVTEALNTLLKLSADHDLNYALGRNGDEVVNRLVEIFDETIGWKHGNSELDAFDSDDEEDDLSDLTPSKKTWTCNASPSTVGVKNLDDFNWSTFCATKFAPTSLNTAMTPSHIILSNTLSDPEDVKRLEIIVMIVRNLSYGEQDIYNNHFLLLTT